MTTASQSGLPDLQYSDNAGFPRVPAPVFFTDAGTPYLRSAGLTLISAPRVDLSGMRDFLEGFGPELSFGQYLNDATELPDGTQLVKTSGQNCYASFGPKRTMNARADVYIDNIESSEHGSVLEHANYSLHVYGVSRSLTHELVRHRAGFGFSQLSQRYVSGRVLRFIERPEYVSDPVLHAEFEDDIDRAATRYESVANRLLALQQEGLGILSAEAKTDLRKKVQQTARSKLPNEAETFLVMTGNVRAWRHFINMRANEHAETEIRAMAVSAYRILSEVDPLLYADMTLRQHTDGTYVVDVKYPKV